MSTYIVETDEGPTTATAKDLPDSVLQAMAKGGDVDAATELFTRHKKGSSDGKDRR